MSREGYYKAYRTLMAQRDDMSSFEVDPPAELLNYKKRVICPNGCFEQSIKYLLNNKYLNDENSLYCYGLWTKFQMEHAWVEIGDLVFDGVFQRFYNKEDYYNYNFITLILTKPKSLAIRESMELGRFAPTFSDLKQLSAYYKKNYKTVVYDERGD